MIKKLYSILSSFSKSKYGRMLNKTISYLHLNDGIKLIDVGAAGEILPRWKMVESHLNYLGFEPDERSRLALLNKENKCLSYEIFDKIASNKESIIDLYLCKNPTNSSTYPPNKDFNDLFSNKNRFEIERTIGLPATTLDNLIDNSDFIKLDIQGGELNALKGGSNLLESTLGLEIEIEFQEIYSNQPLFNEVNSFMKEKNFEFIDFLRLVRWDRDNIYSGVGHCVWGDALFMRTPEYVIKNITNVEVIKRYLAICLIYQRYDFIKVLEPIFKSDINKIFFEKAIKLRSRFLKTQNIKEKINKIIDVIFFENK